MESQRQQKVSRLLQKDLSEIFQKERRNDFGNTFITVTEVKISPDLGVASVYLSFMLTPSPQLALEKVEELNKTIRQDLAKRIRHQMRVIPQLRFFLDNTAEEALRIHKLMDGLDIPKDPDAEKED